jgi:hypothetical protein
MRVWVVVALVVGFGVFGPAQAAEDPAIKWCDGTVVGLIQTPATYRFISGRVDGSNVIVTYDAQNRFGALVRESATCEFSKSNGAITIGAVRFASGYAGYEFVNAVSRVAAIERGVGDMTTDQTGLKFHTQ